MRRFVLEFLGGDWDGKMLDSQSSDREEVKLAQGYFWMTGDGTIGKRIDELSEQAKKFAEGHDWKPSEEPGADNSHTYEVIERREEGERLLVRLKHGAKH